MSAPEEARATAKPAWLGRIFATLGGLALLVLISGSAYLGWQAWQYIDERERIQTAHSLLRQAHSAYDAYTAEHQTAPANLAALGLPERFASGRLELTQDLGDSGLAHKAEFSAHFERGRRLKGGQLFVFLQQKRNSPETVWICAAHELPEQAVPLRCRPEPGLLWLARRWLFLD